MSEPSTEERRVRIQNRAGLHARPAAEFVKLAGKYRSDITLAKGDLEVNGKSIMGVMMLAAEQGTEMVVRGRGEDAEDAVDALTSLIQNGFGES